MGAIAQYTRPVDFDGLVDAIRAFILVDLGLGIEMDYRVEEEACPHHSLAVDGCGARVEIVHDDGQVKVVTGDEYELLELVRGRGGRPPLVAAGRAVRILRTASEGVVKHPRTFDALTPDEVEHLERYRGGRDAATAKEVADA